ncbi:hypothetical protein IQ277_21515 [Nostocales cyanobacterium LEGE 12452]|nr:hypothetical protein [Nostocales cyanobacterium LEGE 12452]
MRAVLKLGGMVGVIGILSLGNILCLPTLAEIPNQKKMILIGVSQPKTESEIKYYLAPDSINKRGRQNFYTLWAFWKNPPKNTYATKEKHAANCQDWEDTRISFASVDAQGHVINEYPDGQKKLVEPGTLDDKALQLVCSR